MLLLLRPLLLLPVLMLLLLLLLLHALQDIPSTDAFLFGGSSIRTRTRTRIRSGSSSSTITHRRAFLRTNTLFSSPIRQQQRQQRQQQSITATATTAATTTTTTSLLAAASPQQQQEQEKATRTRQQQQQQQQNMRRHVVHTPQTTTACRMIQQIGTCIGKGSYGTVHWIQLAVDDVDDEKEEQEKLFWMIGKRAWTSQDLKDEKSRVDRQQQQAETTSRSSSSSSTGGNGKKKGHELEDNNNNNNNNNNSNDKAARCLEYYQTERHCFEQLLLCSSAPQDDDNNNNCNNDDDGIAASSSSLIGRHQQQHYIAPYRGTARDEQGREWMLFDIIMSTTTTSSSSSSNLSNTSEPQKQPQQQQQQSNDNNNVTPNLQNNAIAPSLQDLLEQDRVDHQSNRQHHLYFLSNALGLNQRSSNDDFIKSSSISSSSSSSSTSSSYNQEQNNKNGDNNDCRLVDTLDVFMTQILEMLAFVHARKIVHRDLKPGNLLIGDHGIVLIDFGSAADLSTANSINPLSSLGLLRQGVGLSETRVAVSPIYAAPEVFVDASDWRSALTFDCFSAGLLFCQLLFQYLDERTESGFHQQLRQSNWILDEWLRTTLQSKVQPAGLDEALEVLQERPGLWRLLQGLLEAKPYHRLSSQEALEIWRRILKNGKENKENTAGTMPSDRIFDDGPYLREVLQVAGSCLIDIPPIRPLHFVATFERNQPLGLVLAEAAVSSDDDNDGKDDDMPAELKRQWIQATQGARPGEVFIKEILQFGQADEMGIFAIGDRLQGVGELPLAEGGFERAVELLQDQPKNSAYITLHFDRQPTRAGTKSNDAGRRPVTFEVGDQGAWSSRGRRKTQEDAFIINEVHDSKQRSVLLAGVMDGHLGRAASLFVREELPKAFSEELLQANGATIDKILKETWEQTCQSYHNGCISGEECVADYDPREGMLMANTGSVDAIAGTTACLLALDKQTSDLALLNCGDSRGVVVHSNGKVHFQTTDHTPEYDAERLVQGRQQGLEYSEPRCTVNKWAVPVGDYVYAVARSLEGPFATSKGIVWMPDVTVFQAEPGSTVVIATDGLWEVMDSEQVSQILTKLRYTDSMSASDSAKTLCSLALEKGTSDNVSAVVVYLI